MRSPRIRPSGLETARDIVSGLETHPWGQVTPSVYETARVIALTPWLTGHAERIQYLVDRQRPDGGWGAVDGYDLVPTLSATDALLTTLALQPRYRRAALTPIVDTALRILSTRLRRPSRAPLPDTPAVELIVPALVEALNVQLARLPDLGLDPDRYARRLHPPRATAPDTWQRLRSMVSAGEPLPAKLHHSLEVWAPLPASVRSFPLVPLDGGPDAAVGPATMGASPAATAAWLGGRRRSRHDRAAIRYLETVVYQYGGPVPSVIPVSAFERAWVLTTLHEAGLTVSRSLALRVAATLRPAGVAGGTAGGAGLPTDCDTTAVAMLALHQLGLPVDVDALYAYIGDGYFCTWLGERTASITTNAHVLTTLGTLGSARHRAARSSVVGWLCDRQSADGDWSDKWHASSLYATSVAAVALTRFGGKRGRTAARRAVRWVLRSQRVDGGWGRWGSTAEETAYAVTLLRRTAPEVRARETVTNAIVRGRAYLAAADHSTPGPPLWHDKDLYQPVAVVRATVLAALRPAAPTPADAAGGRAESGVPHPRYSPESAVTLA